MNERWEKLESDRVARDVKALRTLVEEMNASQSELRRQLGNERAARLSLEQQVHASQQSLAVLERTVEKQAVELRVERQRGAAPSREQEHDSRKIAELTARVVDLDAALEEEQEERARISSLVRDMSNSKRGLAERVDGLEQQLSRRKSDAVIERQVHSMQDECLSQVESMSRMLDEMASVATRVDDAEEKISRTVAEEQQRRADWETDQQRHRLEFERSMATLATNQHAVAVATLERRLDDNAAQAEAEQAEEHKAMAEERRMEDRARSRMAGHASTSARDNVVHYVAERGQSMQKQQSATLHRRVDGRKTVLRLRWLAMYDIATRV